MRTLQCSEPSVMDHLGSVVLLHTACLPCVFWVFFSPLGRNKQKKARNKTSASPEALSLYSSKHAFKAQLISASLRGTSPKRAGLVSPHRLPRSGLRLGAPEEQHGYARSLWRRLSPLTRRSPFLLQAMRTLLLRLFGTTVHSSSPQR